MGMFLVFELLSFNVAHNYGMRTNVDLVNVLVRRTQGFPFNFKMYVIFKYLICVHITAPKGWGRQSKGAQETGGRKREEPIHSVDPLFVPRTEGGALINMLRGVEKRLDKLGPKHMPN